MRVARLSPGKFFLYSLLAALAVLFASNRWFEFEAGNEFVRADDFRGGYNTLVEAAPALPHGLLYQHHAQRFLFYYLVGCLEKVSGIPHAVLLRLASLLAILATAALFASLLRRLGLSGCNFLLPLLLYVWNPYAFRYFLVAPGTAIDTVFLAGLALALHGLILRNPLPMYVGLVVATLTRQTIVFFLPGFLLWVLFHSDWKKPRRKVDLGAVLGVFLAVVIPFVLTGKFAATFAKPMPESALSYALRFFHWTQSEVFTWSALLEHLSRALVPVLCTVATLVCLLWTGRAKPRWETVTLLFMGFCAVAQPILWGPSVAGKNAGRLAAFGLMPIVLALALELRRWRWPPWARHRLAVAGGTLCLFAYSLHHLYSAFGPGSAPAFLLLQLSATSLFLVCLKFVKPELVDGARP